jgi:hypothetical protein
MTILVNEHRQQVTILLDAPDLDGQEETRIQILADRRGWHGPVVVATREGRVLFALTPACAPCKEFFDDQP